VNADPMNSTGLAIDPSAFTQEALSANEVSNMERHVSLASDLQECRYFTQELSPEVKSDRVSVTSWEQKMPDRAAPREMVTILGSCFLMLSAVASQQWSRSCERTRRRQTRERNSTTP